MREITKEQVLSRIALENPWHDPPFMIPPMIQNWKPRAYLDLLYPLLKQGAINRAIVLMGPRRVGKTVLIHHAIQRLLEEGVPPKRERGGKI